MFDLLEPIVNTIGWLGSFVESISGAITAVSTLALVALTWVLAVATNAMANATSSTNAVASL
jgi:hypothetical protein